jgi:hypothetical protein
VISVPHWRVSEVVDPISRKIRSIIWEHTEDLYGADKTYCDNLWEVTEISALFGFYEPDIPYDIGMVISRQLREDFNVQLF